MNEFVPGAKPQQVQSKHQFPTGVTNVQQTCAVNDSSNAIYDSLLCIHSVSKSLDRVLSHSPPSNPFRQVANSPFSLRSYTSCFVWPRKFSFTKLRTVRLVYGATCPVLSDPRDSVSSGFGQSVWSTVLHVLFSLTPEIQFRQAPVRPVGFSNVSAGNLP